MKRFALYFFDRNEWRAFIGDDDFDVAIDWARWSNMPDKPPYAIVRADGVIIMQSKDADVNGLKLKCAAETFASAMQELRGAVNEYINRSEA